MSSSELLLRETLDWINGLDLAVPGQSPLVYSHVFYFSGTIKSYWFRRWRKRYKRHLKFHSQSAGHVVADIMARNASYRNFCRLQVLVNRWATFTRGKRELKKEGVVPVLKRPMTLIYSLKYWRLKARSRVTLKQRMMKYWKRKWVVLSIFYSAFKKFAATKKNDCFQRWKRRTRWEATLVTRERYTLKMAISLWAQYNATKALSKNMLAQAQRSLLHRYLCRWRRLHVTCIDASLLLLARSISISHTNTSDTSDIVNDPLIPISVNQSAYSGDMSFISRSSLRVGDRYFSGHGRHVKSYIIRCKYMLRLLVTRVYQMMDRSTGFYSVHLCALRFWRERQLGYVIIFPLHLLIPSSMLQTFH